MFTATTLERSSPWILPWRPWQPVLRFIKDGNSRDMADTEVVYVTHQNKKNNPKFGGVFWEVVGQQRPKTKMVCSPQKKRRQRWLTSQIPALVDWVCFTQMIDTFFSLPSPGVSWGNAYTRKRCVVSERCSSQVFHSKELVPKAIFHVPMVKPLELKMK